MSFRACMDEAVKGKEISRAQADRLIGEFERLRDGYRRSNPSMADALAKQDLLDSLTKTTAEKRRQAKLALNALRRIDAEVGSHKNASGRFDVIDGFQKVLEHHGEAGFTSVAGRQLSLYGTYQGYMSELLDHFRPGRIAGAYGRRNKADMRMVAREAFGEDTGDAQARALANAWLQTADLARRDFNAAGGAIAKLDNWGLPQHHDGQALTKVGREAWKEYIRPLLDVSKMTNGLTGKSLDGKGLEDALDHVYDSIVTDGWSNIEPSRQAMGRGAVANRRAEHRFLVFRNADDWMKYQEDFGGGDDIVSIMMNHLDGMAKDTGAMQVLGPNPSGTVEWMKQALTKEAHLAAAGMKARTGGSKGLKAKTRAKVAATLIDHKWASIRGALETPDSETLAGVMGTARATVRASVLGSAAISSITDIPTQMIQRYMTGLPVWNAIPQIIKSFTTLEKNEATAAGLILDSALNSFHSHARKAGVLVKSRQMAEFMNERVLSVTGLLPGTQASRNAFGLEFMATAARHSTLPFKELPPWFRQTLEGSGFAEKQWDMVRKAKLHEKYDGTQILRPREIGERIDPKLAARYLEVINNASQYAIITGGHSSRVATTFGTRPGTIVGEAVRTGMMLKSFPVTMLMMYGGRTLRMLAGGNWAGAGVYAGALLVSTTIFGAAAYQLKQMVFGKDPQDMTTGKFWLAAALQGGGLGLYGDFFFSDVNRYGNGKIASMLGPMAGRVEDVLGLGQRLTANAVMLGDPDAPNLGRAVTHFLRGNIPGGNIWYTKLIWDREVMDQLQYLLDPDANKAFKRAQRNAQNDKGQEFWWKPGETAPARGPDLGATVR